jgi:hypothetical protein
LQIELWLRKERILLKKGKGEGYGEYPSPEFRLGDFESQQQHSIDATDFGFDQGNRSIGERFSLATSGAMSTMRALQAVGAWFCFGVFRWLLGASLVKTSSNSILMTTYPPLKLPDLNQVSTFQPRLPTSGWPSSK